MTEAFPETVLEQLAGLRLTGSQPPRGRAPAAKAPRSSRPGKSPRDED